MKLRKAKGNISIALRLPVEIHHSESVTIGQISEFLKGLQTRVQTQLQTDWSGKVLTMNLINLIDEHSDTRN